MSKLIFDKCNLDLSFVLLSNFAICEAFLIDCLLSNLFLVDKATLFLALIVGQELIRTLNFFDRNFLIKYNADNQSK